MFDVYLNEKKRPFDRCAGLPRSRKGTWLLAEEALSTISERSDTG